MIVYDGDERLLVSLVSERRRASLMETWSPKLVENVVPDHFQASDRSRSQSMEWNSQ
jgi:hypothetical protein